MMIASTVVSYRDGTLLTVVRVLPFYVGPIAAIWVLSIPFTRGILGPKIMPARQSAARPMPSPAQRRQKLAAMVSRPV